MVISGCAPAVDNRHTLSDASSVEEWDYAFDPGKNAWLIQGGGVSFEQIIALIEGGKLIQVLEHPDERYPHQLLCEVVWKKGYPTKA